MDPISQKILEARNVREQAEARRLREAQDKLEAVHQTEEFKRHVRITDLQLKMYETLKTRCKQISAETADLPKNEQLFLETDEDLDPIVAIVHSPNIKEWVVRLNEARLCIQADPVGFDEDVDFFGSIAILGRFSARKSFFISPKGEFFVVQDACDGTFVCPSDYYSLHSVLRAGATAVPSSFAQLLDEGLNALVTVGLEDGLPGRSWFPIETSSPLTRTTGYISKATFKKLGVDVNELKKLAGVTAQPPVEAERVMTRRA